MLTLLLACAPVDGPLFLDAGYDITGQPGQTFRFDGTESVGVDTFQWTLTLAPEGSEATLDFADSARPELVPDRPGLYLLEVTACGPDMRCHVDDVLALVGEFMPVSGAAPSADAGADVSGASTSSATSLDGTGTTDPEGDTLTYVWSFSSQPSGSALVKADITDRFTTSPSFTPDVDGVYKLRLYVTDGTGFDQDSVRVVTAGNTAPTSDAGTDQNVTTSTTVTLDGSGSSDPQGDELYYRWAFRTVPATTSLTNGSLTDRFTSGASFTPDVQGTFEMKLVADDYAGSIDKDFVLITATNTGNSAPVADAGGDQTGEVGDTFNLSSSGSTDADGDTLYTSWVLTDTPSGSSLTNASFSARFSTSTTLTPDVVGIYEVKAKVDDGAAQDVDVISVGVSVVNNSAPVADAGSDADALVDVSIALDGTGTSDADGDSLTYRWTFDSVPAASALTSSDISDRMTDSPSFTPDEPGTYTLKLAAEDYVTLDRDYVDIEAYSFNYDDDIQPLWTSKCSGCHITSTSGGLDLTTSSDQINVVSDDVGTMDRIEPGSTANSYIWHKLNGTQSSVGGAGDQMPKGRTALGASDLAMIETWILEGAPDF